MSGRLLVFVYLLTFQLVDSNGAIIANTAVPSNMQCYCISSDYGTSTDSTVGGTRIMAADQLRSEGSQSTTVQYVSSQPQPVVSAAEPTFSFAQLGSGGQVSALCSNLKNFAFFYKLIFGF